MAPLQPAHDKILVAIQKKTAFVRVSGRGSFKISGSLKEFGNSAIGKMVSDIVIDMADCIGMDSTFMGVVAGLAFRLNKKSGGNIHMVDLTTRTRSLMATLGLDQLVKPYMPDETPERFKDMMHQARHSEAKMDEPASRGETAEMMLEAHENLVELSQENIAKFKDVLTFLREDVRKHKTGNSE